MSGVSSHEQVEEVGPQQVRQLADALAGADPQDVLDVSVERCLVPFELLLYKESFERNNTRINYHIFTI